MKIKQLRKRFNKLLNTQNADYYYYTPALTSFPLHV